MNLVIQSDLFGMVKWPFQRLSDLQLGDEKVTLNHLEDSIPNSTPPKNHRTKESTFEKEGFVVIGMSELGLKNLGCQNNTSACRCVSNFGEGPKNPDIL